ncbi:unnamed protein product [Caenorhabditis sp. 36 PRJEB53466]|nr:unnamed protein product [Caenorhabditis sp. 36 PRJEB53466]
MESLEILRQTISDAACSEDPLEKLCELAGIVRPEVVATAIQLMETEKVRVLKVNTTRKRNKVRKFEDFTQKTVFDWKNEAMVMRKRTLTNEKVNIPKACFIEVESAKRKESLQFFYPRVHYCTCQFFQMTVLNKQSEFIYECLGSGQIGINVLFEKKEFAKYDEDANYTLQLLANCVHVANCTILRERNLLPSRYFRSFRVYGDVTGYLMDQETVDGKKLAFKMNALDPEIRERRLRKLAIVVEETLNTEPIEAFVWSFRYDSNGGASAQIGYNGRNTKFTVNYKNMEQTCQEFCKLFSDLQKILCNLSPLPDGMVPSLKVAYHGDPEFVEGFEPVEEFVNVHEIGIGEVAFPFNNGFSLSFASQFQMVTNQDYGTPLQRSASEINHTDLYEDMEDYGDEHPKVERTRRNTLVIGENDDVSMNGSDAILAGDNERLESMICNPNVTSDEIRGIPSEAVDVLYGSPVILNSHKSPEDQEKTVKRSQRISASKRRPESPQKKRLEKKKTPTRRGQKESSKKRTYAGNKEQKKKSARHLRKELDKAKQVIEVANEEDEEMDEIEETGRKERKKNVEIQLAEASPVEQQTEEQELSANFGRVATIREHSESPRSQERSSRSPRNYGRWSSVKKAVQEAAGESQEHTPKTSRNYGRVRSVKKVSDKRSAGESQEHTPKTSRNYGRVGSVKKVLDGDSSEVSQGDTPNSSRSYGRVQSVKNILAEGPVARIFGLAARLHSPRNV